MLALGVVVEGCSEFMMPHMNEVWGIIELCLRDSDNSVKKATCVALSCLCEWCEDECAAKHATLIPVGIISRAEVFVLNSIIYLF